MRQNLMNERKKNNLTQREVAKILYISVTHYQNIEYGTRQGSIQIWDKLEDLFKIPQRQLRENTDIRKEKKK